jgi:hypothetical protein
LSSKSNGIAAQMTVIVKKKKRESSMPGCPVSTTAGVFKTMLISAHCNFKYTHADPDAFDIYASLFDVEDVATR